MGEQLSNVTYDQFRDFRYMDKLTAFVREHKKKIEEKRQEYKEKGEQSDEYAKLGKFFAKRTGIELTDDQKDELGSDIVTVLTQIQQEAEIEKKMQKLRDKKDKLDSQSEPTIPKDYGTLKRN